MPSGDFGNGTLRLIIPALRELLELLARCLPRRCAAERHCSRRATPRSREGLAAVETFLAQPAVGALDGGVLIGLAGLDEMQLDVVAVRPACSTRLINDAAPPSHVSRRPPYSLFQRLERPRVPAS